MNVDVIKQVGAVIREVSAGEREGRPSRSVIASRLYPTPVEDVWEAITTPERLARWLTPVSGELKLRGRFQLKDNASGEILTCERPRRLAVTWEFGGETSWVDVR